MFKYAICSCLLIMATAFCYSQTVKISGRVVNESNMALPNVTIFAKQNNIIKTYTQSDSNGYFSLSLLVTQKYTFQMSSVGYKKLETELLVSETQKENTYILIRQIKIEDTVRISAKRGYYERGDTIFYNTDVYKRNNENNLKDLLNNLPGVQVTQSGKIMVGGQTVQKVLIEGKDLTGDDYEKIINNLSPHGLDQIQVLKKYRDPFSLSASITSDTELAINLTFKKKKLIPSAKFSLSLGLPVNYFEQKTDFLIISKHITGLTFINWNTTGNTFQYIASPNEILGSYNPSAFSKLGKGLSYFNGVNELFLPITKNFYSFNNSKYFDNSSQVNFSKNTTNKITITYAPEKIEQTENRLSQTFVGNQLFSETKSFRNPIINNEKIIVKNELIWMVKPNRQLKFETNFNKENSRADDDGLLNNKTTIFNTDNNKTIINTLVNFTTYLKKSRLFNAAFFYEFQKNKEWLYSEAVAYNGTLFSNMFGITKNLNQQKINNEYNLGGYLKLIKHKNDHSITIQPTYKFLKGNFYSNLSATSTTDYLFTNIDSFHNQFQYSQNSLSLPIRYKYDDVHDIYNFSIQAEPFILMRQKFYTISHTNYIDFNADADFKYKLKNRKVLSISARKRYIITNAEQILQNNIIKSNRNIQSKTDFITNNTGYNINASFNNNSFNKKIRNSYSIGYIINEPNYISNATSSNLFSLYTYLPFTNVNKSLNSSIRNEISLKSLKLKLDHTLSINIGQNYSAQNSYLLLGTFKGLAFDNRIKSAFANSLNFDWNNSFSYSNSKIENSPINYINYTNISTLIININYMKKIHLDFSFKDFYVYTPASKQKNNLLFANVSYKQLFNKNKIRFTVELNNLFNKKRFSNQTISATQYHETSTILIPFYAIAKVEFLL
jgi:hypothetical protein